MKKQVTDSYFRFIVRKEQLRDWLVLLGSISLGVLFITHFYPYPSIVSDSYGYLSAALQDLFNPYRPFGYSFFLRVVHLFSTSIFSVVISNAFFYCISVGLLLLAVKKIWPPERQWLFTVIEILVALNPVSLYMLDTIMSDSLFCSLCLIMLAMCIIVVKEQSVTASLLFVLSFFCSLHTRYSAIFFPIAFIPVLILYGKKLAGILSIVGMIVAIVIFRNQTSENMYATVRMRQASTGFEGWQLANNGLHIIPFLEKNDMDQPDDPEIAFVHQFFLTYSDMIAQKTLNGKVATASFMWSNDSPLKHLLFYYIDRNHIPYLLGWVHLGSGIYAKYGKWLILHYPAKFLRYYLWPNMGQMFFPKSFEIIGNNDDIPVGQKEITTFFELGKDVALKCNDVSFFKTKVRPIIPYLELLTWILFAISALALLWTKSLPFSDKETRRLLLLLFLFGFVYYGTTTFASPIAVRYWMPMHAVKLIFVWISLKVIFVKVHAKSVEK